MSSYYNQGVQVIIGNGQNFPGTPRISLIPFIQNAYDKGLLNFTVLPPGSISLAEIQDISTAKILGRSTAGSGVIEQISIGTGLSLSGGILSSTATATPGGSDTQIQYNNAGAFGGSSQLIFNAGATNTLDITGSDSTGSANSLRIRNSSGTDLIIVDNSANVGLGTSNRLNGLSAINYLDIGTFASTTGGINVMGYSSLGGTSSNGWGAVGSNYFLNSANVLKRRFVDPVSILTFESGGFHFKNAGSAAINSTISLTQLASINSGGFFALNVTTALAGFHNNINTTASTPSVLISGAGFSGGTGSTTKPTFLIEPTGTTSTGWGTSGTKFGVNAESGFTGNLLDAQINGVSYASVTSTGVLTLGTGTTRTTIRPTTVNTTVFENNGGQWGSFSGNTWNIGLWGSNAILNASNSGDGNSNRYGIGLELNSGRGTGNGIGGDIIFKTAPAGSSGTSLNALVTRLTINGETGVMTSASNKINLSTSKTPSSAADTGTTGDICWDADYIYVCVATNTWKRVAISTW
ncbi:hypothetical protein EKK58_07605 [Candidatus Dependentiae bacterium]|nr:MAG: hypothetical protein EKK58_07605 [Candidatus Dependentiae bacterium]